MQRPKALCRDRAGFEVYPHLVPELVSEGAFGAPSVSDCGPARNAGVEPRSTLVAMMTCIERTYHRRRRRQSRLGRLTPTEFETIMNTTVALAA